MENEIFRVSSYAGLLSEIDMDAMNNNLDYMLKNALDKKINAVDARGKLNVLYMECCMYIIGKITALIKSGESVTYCTLNDYSTYVERFTFETNDYVEQWKELDMDTPMNVIIRKLRTKGVELTVELIDEQRNTYKLKLEK